MFFTLFFILFMFSFLRSNLRRHIIFMVSINKLDLIFKSRGDSVASEGLKLTSISHGFISESSKMSNPRSSKQIFLCGIRFNPAVIWQSTLIKLFKMTSYIRDQSRFISIPNFSRYLFIACKLHL
jgi:hypothetical protein